MTVYHRYDLDAPTDSGEFEPMAGINSVADFEHILTNTNTDSFEDEELVRRAFEAGHDLYTFVDPYLEEKSGQRVLVVNLSQKLAQSDFEERMSILSQAFKDGSIRYRQGWE